MTEVNNKRNEYVHPKKIKLDKQKKDSLKMIRRISKILQNEFEMKLKPPENVVWMNDEI